MAEWGGASCAAPMARSLGGVGRDAAAWPARHLARYEPIRGYAHRESHCHGGNSRGGTGEDVCKAEDDVASFQQVQRLLGARRERRVRAESADNGTGSD